MKSSSRCRAQRFYHPPTNLSVLSIFTNIWSEHIYVSVHFLLLISLCWRDSRLGAQVSDRTLSASAAHLRSPDTVHCTDITLYRAPLYTVHITLRHQYSGQWTRGCLDQARKYKHGRCQANLNLLSFYFSVINFPKKNVEPLYSLIQSFHEFLLFHYGTFISPLSISVLRTF